MIVRGESTIIDYHAPFDHCLTLLSSISHATGEIFAIWCRHCYLVLKNSHITLQSWLMGFLLFFWQRFLKYLYVYLVLKHVVHAKQKEIFVYLVLKRVFWVEKTGMYYLRRSTCNPSGMEGNVHFACSKIVLRKWSENRSGKQYFIHWCILTLLESVMYLWKYTLWCILTFVRKRVARVERKVINNISRSF